MNINYMAVTWNLKLLQVKRDINSQQLAEMTGLHPGSIAKLRKNRPKQLTMETLTKLCNALRCKPGDLLGWDDDSNAA